MATQGGGISGVAVGMATAGAFLLYIGIQGVPVREGLKSLVSGSLPQGAPKAGGAVASAEAALAQGAGAAGSGAGSPTGAGSKLAQAALAYRGVPYMTGGQSRKGMDCSGLVVKAFQDAYGITPPRTTYVQVVWKQLKPVPAGQMAAGDLCFWPAIGPPGHVAIAISATEVIHAPRPGKVVEVVPVSRAFVGGARPLVLRYTGSTS